MKAIRVLPAPGCSPRINPAQPRGHRGGSEGTFALGRALHCAHTAGSLRNVNNGDERRERDHKEPHSHSRAAKRDRGPRGGGGARRAIPRQHEPPRLWNPENRASGGKSFSPPPALCSGPTRSRLSSSAARAILSLLARKGAQAAGPPAPLPARPGRAPLSGRASKATAAALQIASLGAAHGPKPRPLSGRAGEQLDHTAHLGREESLSRRRTGSQPEEPARRRASTPSRPAAGPHFLCTARPPPLAFISGSHTAPGRRREPWRPLPTCGAWGPAGPALPGPPHGQRPRCAPRDVLLGSRAAPAARAGPGRPRLLSPAPRCPRRGLARSAVRTMGSGPRWEGRRDKRGGRRSAPPPTPKSCRPPPSRRRSAQLPPPAVGWKPRA